MLCCELRPFASCAAKGTLWWSPQCELKPVTLLQDILLVSCSYVPISQDWPLLMPDLGPLGGSYNARYDQLPLVLCLRPLSKSV